MTSHVPIRTAVALMFLSWQLVTAATPISAADAQGDRQAAAIIFNKANDAIARQDWSTAVDLLKQSCQTDESFAQAHSNLGYCLMKAGRQLEARTELEKATTIDPKLPEPWPSLGQIYVATGNLPAAVHAYQKYLELAPKSPQRHNVEQALVSIKHQITLNGGGTGSSASSNSSDYLTACNDRGLFTWSASRMPIKVFISSGDAVPGFKPVYKMILNQAFSDWAAASNGHISFSLVTTPEQADILCTWTDDKSHLTSSIEGGQANWKARPGEGLTHCDILLLTVDPAPSVHLTDAMMGWVTRHEIGHALGMHGHSSNPSDIMYFSATPDSFATRLSPRDKNTLARLYKY